MTLKVTRYGLSLAPIVGARRSTSASGGGNALGGSSYTVHSAVGSPEHYVGCVAVIVSVESRSYGDDLILSTSQLGVPGSLPLAM